MEKNISLEIDKEALRKGLIKYTIKAFQILPSLEKPSILDIGCGSGIPTIELARLSNGEVIGIDIDRSALNELTKKIKEAGLDERVRAIRCSVFDMNFADEDFDIVWAEGVISVIGFEKGLKEWYRFIKPKGFLVIHDEISDIPRKLELISVCGYKLIGKFMISYEAWWNEYFHPLERRIKELRRKYCEDKEALSMLDKERKDIDDFKNNPKYHGSVFFILQKGTRHD